jgi:hypothetical protein
VTTPVTQSSVTERWSETATVPVILTTIVVLLCLAQVSALPGLPAKSH